MSEIFCTRGPHRIQSVCPDAHGVACSPPTETLSQSEIDARNLEFYAMMFRAKRWELQTMSWTVFEATLNAIAGRIRAEARTIKRQRWEGPGPKAVK